MKRKLLKNGVQSKCDKGTRIEILGKQTSEQKILEATYTCIMQEL